MPIIHDMAVLANWLQRVNPEYLLTYPSMLAHCSRTYRMTMV